MSAEATRERAAPGKRRGRPPIPRKPGLEQASPQARRQAAAILEVLAGQRTPADAAEALGTSLVRYYLLERRAIEGLLAACEPAARGPQPDPARRIAALEKELTRWTRECQRQQALVRATGRTLGLPAGGAARPAARDQEEPAGRKRRKRRPTARALKLAGLLKADDAKAGGVAEGVASSVSGVAVEAGEASSS